MKLSIKAKNEIVEYEDGKIYLSPIKLDDLLEFVEVKENYDKKNIKDVYIKFKNIILNKITKIENFFDEDGNEIQNSKEGYEIILSDLNILLHLFSFYNDRINEILNIKKK